MWLGLSEAEAFVAELLVRQWLQFQMPHLACLLLTKHWKNIAQVFTQSLLLAGQLQKTFLFSPIQQHCHEKQEEIECSSLNNQTPFPAKRKRKYRQKAEGRRYLGTDILIISDRYSHCVSGKSCSSGSDTFSFQGMQIVRLQSSRWCCEADQAGIKVAISS